MNILGNIIWLVFGGLFSAIGYFTVGLAYCVSIIGIPWGIQCFKLGVLSLFPFSQRLERTEFGESSLSLILNILWIFTGGIALVLNHLVWGIVLCISIIGIPFGLQHFKLMKLAFTPFGRDIDF